VFTGWGDEDVSCMGVWGMDMCRGGGISMCMCICICISMFNSVYMGHRTIAYRYYRV
jgi:cell division protein FtsL